MLLIFCGGNSNPFLQDPAVPEMPGKKGNSTSKVGHT
jgi:hypothetical protein